MADKVQRMRRVVTGNDSRGRSKVLYDSAAPNTRRRMAQMWSLASMPASIAGDEDFGLPPFTADPPRNGLFLRIVENEPVPPGYDPAKDPEHVPEHPPVFDEASGRGDRGGRAQGRSPIHRTRSVDYGVVLEGARDLALDEDTIHMVKGDVVVQLGNFHQWIQPDTKEGTVTAFVMIGGTFD